MIISLINIAGQIIACIWLLVIARRFHNSYQQNLELSKPFPFLANAVISLKEIKNETVLVYQDSGKVERIVFKDKDLYRKDNMGRIVTLLIYPSVDKDPKIEIIPLQIINYNRAPSLKLNCNLYL